MRARCAPSVPTPSRRRAGSPNDNNTQAGNPIMNETATLARYAAELRYEDIPAEVLQRARNTICDMVGAAVFGYSLPWSQMIVDYATTYGPGGKSRILGPGAGTVQAGMAALANGAMAHAFELD